MTSFFTRLLTPIILFSFCLPTSSQAALTCDQLFERVVEFRPFPAEFLVRPALENSTLDISSREGWDFTLTERSTVDEKTTALIRAYLWPSLVPQRLNANLRRLATWTQVASVKSQSDRGFGVAAYSISRLATDRGHEVQTELVFSINRNGDYAAVQLSIDTKTGPLVDFRFDPAQERLFVLTYKEETKTFQETVYRSSIAQGSQQISLKLDSTRELPTAEVERLYLQSVGGP